MFDFTRILPTKVFCCLDFDPGTKLLLSLIILFRFVSMILGCLYGPYLYLVLPLGGLYLAADILLLYTIFGSGLQAVNEDFQPEPLSEAEGDAAKGCDFKTQKIWIWIWLILNVFAIAGLAVALGLFGNLGWWSMTYTPIHVAVFFMILILVTLLIYGQIIVLTVYLLLKEAWMRGLMGNANGWAEDMAGLTHGGKRIFA